MKTQVKNNNYNLERLQKAYQADQQLKYMSLEAELELLLHQIQVNKANNN
ncbi:hypothetical protein GM3708_2412 [Geminocystis sp. NIES-3708]|nr:hypothetical protein [Geminocystis sp. NIES-3708]BAQ62006.1 hypothetical protein GM3708_2412 [Geminocystis sp. NIES-3708]